MSEPSVIEQRNYDAAVRAHQFVVSSGTEGFKSTIAAAAETLKVLITINAGGALALLGFIGAIAGKEKAVFASAQPFLHPMTLFGSGMTAAVFAMGMMYFAQLAFTSVTEYLWFDVEHPYAHHTGASRRRQRVGRAFQLLAIVLAVTSFALFVCGLWSSNTLIGLARL